MFERLRKSKLMFWSLELLILASLIFISSKLDFLIAPISVFFSTLFAPILVAGFLFYILNPLVNFFERHLKLKRIYGIILVFVLFLLGIVWLLLSVIPNLVYQLSNLAANMPEYIQTFEAWLYSLADSPLFKEVDLANYIKNLDISYGELLQKFFSGISSSLGSVVGKVASATVVVVTVPFVLFYMLKDGNRMVSNIQGFFPESRRQQIVELLGQLNATLANYISGQAIECLFVGTFTFLGYVILGVDYAFLFGVIAGLTNLIPYIGPYLGLAPAFLITVFDSPIKAALCCLVVLVVQQLDGNIIYPNVIGKSLAIHPLTIILVLLVAGKLAGLLGIFLGVPFYAVGKTIFSYLRKILAESHEKEQLDVNKKAASEG